MIRTAVVGVGKMGLSHLAMLRATPGVQVVAVCDSSNYLLAILSKYADLPTYSNYSRMLEDTDLDAVVISTPSGTHADLVRDAIANGLHIFCEKPFCLDADDATKLAEEAITAGLVTQVGYHNRFVGTFREVKALLDQRAIGDVTHILGEAYGPVVLKAQGSTWRTNRAAGGGCLYDYAAHPLNLINWYLGEPTGAGGSALTSIFSRDTDDAVVTNLFFAGGRTAQVSANWSDDSVRKMTTRITVWGTQGQIFADRQECQAYLRTDAPPPGYRQGWNVRYTTELTEPVHFHLRGEEYSAQLEEFAHRIEAGRVAGANDFASAAATDRSIALIRSDALRGPGTTTSDARLPSSPLPSRRVDRARLHAAWERVRTSVMASRAAHRVTEWVARLLTAARKGTGR